MINVKNQFQENNLSIEFSGESIDTNNINIEVSNDVNFKPVIDYLIQLISNRKKLESTFEDSSQEENIDKLSLIQDTVTGIYDKFNLSIDNFSAIETTQEETNGESEPDDLPF